MKNLIKRFAADDAGATAIEYGLIAALIAVGVIAMVRAIGTNLSTTFSTIADELPG
jgi:pilus assembly protein Flp/PilA